MPEMLLGLITGVMQNAAWDLTKFSGAHLRKRLSTPAVQARMVSAIERDLREHRITDVVVQRIVAVLKNNHLLDGSADQDIQELELSLRRYLSEDGCTAAQIDFTAVRFIRQVIIESSSNRFTGSVNADQFIKLMNDHRLSDELDAEKLRSRNPDVAVATLATMLREAQQHEASVRVSADGNVEVTGTVHLQITGSGEAGARLARLQDDLQLGQDQIFDINEGAEIVVTAGHPQLDQYLKLDAPGRIRIGLSPIQVTERLRVRVGTSEMEFNARVILKGESLTIELVDLHAFDFSLHLTPGQFSWNVSRRDSHPAIGSRDRAAIQAIRMILTDGAVLQRVETGGLMVEAPSGGDKARTLALMNFYMQILNVTEFLEHQFGTGAVTLPADMRFEPDEQSKLSIIANTITQTIVKTPLTMSFELELIQSTVDNLSAGSRFYARFTDKLTVFGENQIELILDLIVSKVVVTHHGKRVPKKRIASLVGSTVDIEWRGIVQRATIKPMMDEANDSQDE